MPVLCFVCDKLFSTQSNLNKHTTKVHHQKPKIVGCDNSKWNYKCLEKGCNNSFQHKIGLRSHLSEYHKFTIETETKEFSNNEEFIAWKYLIEKATKSNYIVSRKYKVKGKPAVSYSCNRSGKICTKSSGLRLPKSQGPCKLGRYCISMIKVVKGKTIVATWVKSHYGHVSELQHLRLSKMDRSLVASKLTLGVPPSRILDSYRDNIKEDINREDLITRKDIRNIKSSYHINISEGVKHNDAVSVDLWVQTCKEDENNPVLFYKAQGVEDTVYKLHSVDFCLVIMTAFQKSMIKQFGCNIIAVDGTHGLNNYDFDLTTLMVVDEFGEGVPVAFLFSNRKDTYIYEIFFNLIKLDIVVLHIKTFMSDIVSTFYNAWCAVMGPAIHQLFCSWHIDRAWQQNLSKIRDKVKRSETYKIIKVIQQNTSRSEFHDALKNTVAQLISDTDTQEFDIYFKNNYSLIYEKWAYCFREGCGINTNMRIESMHKVLKYFYLDGKKVKRLDKALHSLMKFVRDKCIERHIKQIKGKNSTHIKQIISRHKTAILNNFSVDIDLENPHIWYIESDSLEQKSDVYCIQKLYEHSCCDLKCKECDVCCHTYSCTCNDFCICNTICKHIHYISMNYDTTKLKTEGKKDYQHNLNNCESSTTPSPSTTPYVSKSDILRQNFIVNIKSTINMLQNVDHKKLDDEVIVQIQSHVDTIKKLLELPSTCSETFTHIDNPKEPANKKILKQNRFFSTQKKRRVNVNAYKKPTTSEVVDIGQTLKNNFIELYVSSDPTNDHDYT